MTEKNNFTLENFADKIDKKNNLSLSDEQRKKLMESYAEIETIYGEWQNNLKLGLDQDEPTIQNPIDNNLGKMPISEVKKALEKLLGIHKQKEVVIKETQKNTGELDEKITSNNENYYEPINDGTENTDMFTKIAEAEESNPNSEIIQNPVLEDEEIDHNGCKNGVCPSEFSEKDNGGNKEEAVWANNLNQVEINENKEAYKLIRNKVDLDSFIRKNGGKAIVILANPDGTCPGCDQLKNNIKENKPTIPIAVVSFDSRTSYDLKDSMSSIATDNGVPYTMILTKNNGSYKDIGNLDKHTLSVDEIINAYNNS